MSKQHKCNKCFMIFNKKTNYIRHISRKKPCAITDRKHITEPDKDYSEINEYENYLNQVFQNNNLETRVISILQKNNLLN